MQKCEGEIQKITVWFLRSKLLPETLPETLPKVAVLHLEISGFYSERWLIKVIHSRTLSGLIYRKLCDIWIKVSFRGFARQFISSCLLIKNSC